MSEQRNFQYISVLLITEENKIEQIWGIHCAQARKHASEGSTLALKPEADVARSPKQGYQPHKKDLCPPKMYRKKTIVEFDSPGKIESFQ